MSQFVDNFTNFGTANTSTSAVVIRSSPGTLATIQINSTGIGTIIFYDATSSSTGNEIASIPSGPVGVYVYNIVLKNGLTRGATSSTADVTVAWA